MLKRVAASMAFASQQCLLSAGIGTLVALAMACGGIDQQPVSPASPTMSTAVTGASQSSSATAVLRTARDLRRFPETSVGRWTAGSTSPACGVKNGGSSTQTATRPAR